MSRRYAGGRKALGQVGSCSYDVLFVQLVENHAGRAGLVAGVVRCHGHQKVKVMVIM